MTDAQFWLLLGCMAAGFAGLWWWLKRAQGASSGTQLEQMVNQVFGLTSQKFAEQSKQLLQSEKEIIQVDLDNKHQAIEKLVTNLHLELRERQQELRVLEQDRVKKFSELATTLDQHRKLAEDLRVSTQQLAGVLSNNQARGEWGERIIEDLLQTNGLIEGVHYKKQTALAETTLRPDIILLLPNNRTVPVDVKFPYAEIQKMANASSPSDREVHRKQFGQDLKIKIDKVAAYINPQYQTLDYAILFVPNEMVFSFLNQHFAQIVDDALAKRVIIVSPFTFIIVARTVMESYRNFMVEDKLRDILQYVAEFTTEWAKFKEEFAKFGRAIESVRHGYDTLLQTRTPQLDKKINKIARSEQGSLLSGNTTPVIALELEDKKQG